MRFEGKTVLVTGAASGIGAATAKRFSDEGANVVLTDIADMSEVAGGLTGDRTESVECDVSKLDDCKAAVDRATKVFGGVDVLVANAGIAKVGTMSELEDGEFHEQIEINVIGVYHIVKASWDSLKKREGCVIATSSVSGLRGDWGAFAYNTSKGAVSNMVRSLALDFVDSGVRVNAVAPGFTKTGLTDEMLEDEEFMDAMRSRIPMSRGAEPSEIASVIAFLASKDASFVNGVVMPVDGGVSASNGQPPLG